MTFYGNPHAVRWDADGVINNLENLPDGSQSQANAINNYSQVVGSSENDTGYQSAVLWDANGVINDLENLPGGRRSVANGINDNGQVVGWSNEASGNLRAVLWDANGVINDLENLPGGIMSQANAINNYGQVVGWSNDASGNPHAVLWTVDGVQDLGTLYGRPSSMAYGISDNGQVVGSSNTGLDPTDAFKWTLEDGMYLLNPLPGVLKSTNKANGVNDNGQVVGSSFVWSQVIFHAVIWDANGVINDLGTLPGGSGSFASDINDNGQVVGSSNDASDNLHAVLWTVRPDPSEAIQNLINKVDALNLQLGISSSLDAKLDAAKKALQDVNINNNAAATNALDAFINAVMAQRGKDIPLKNADALVIDAKRIINELSV